MDRCRDILKLGLYLDITAVMSFSSFLFPKKGLKMPLGTQCLKKHKNRTKLSSPDNLTFGFLIFSGALLSKIGTSWERLACILFASLQLTLWGSLPNFFPAPLPEALFPKLGFRLPPQHEGKIMVHTQTLNKQGPLWICFEEILRVLYLLGEKFTTRETL